MDDNDWSLRHGINYFLIRIDQGCSRSTRMCLSRSTPSAEKASRQARRDNRSIASKGAIQATPADVSFEAHSEPKRGLDPGSIETVSRYFPTLELTYLAEIEEGREAGGNVFVSLGRVRLQKHEALGGKTILVRSRVRSKDEMNILN